MEAALVLTNQPERSMRGTIIMGIRMISMDWSLIKDPINIVYAPEAKPANIKVNTTNY